MMLGTVRPGAATRLAARMPDPPSSTRPTVFEGALGSKVNDAPVTTYEAGQSFF
jgi:hypothetical protein